MIFTTAGEKGGSGRSTIAEHFTVWLSKQGFDVLLIDADEQGTASDFTAWREQTLDGNVGYTLVQLVGANLRKQVETMKSKYDHIVIDTGGRDTTSQRAALFASDVAIIPIQPRSHDIWTLAKFTEILEEIQATRATPLIAYTFLNRADITSADNRESAEALSAIEQMTFIDCPVKNRKAYPNSGSAGLTVFEMGEKADLKAINEITELFKRISHVNINVTA
ncbi:AAA family ATPase [Dyadobacter psychrophilus]|uniref:Chromosome partitioning protein n=1 Tax=Dyadobacter psychrophilus TaxID=651661 RepID=A0A1T5HGC7_9BACT|nr:AAA family ATPase [Dyadobacter psychrophilus]SKC19620.1 chromosome partitioning protein [Dyadobacter psychrophilus]